MQYTIYDRASGRIIRHVSSQVVPYLSAGEAALEGEYDEARYLIRHGKPVVPPAWQPTVTPNRISGIPAGSRVEYHGAVHGDVVVDDGVLELDLVAGQWVRVVIQPPTQVMREVVVTG